jgi:hypothetical protein
MRLIGIGLMACIVCASASADIPRAADGRPDISGTYNMATLTPIERPEAFGENLYLSPERAEELTAQAAQMQARLNERSDPNRDAPEEGAAVGGYNFFWIDRGDSIVTVDGKFRTSILTQPANGRIPPMTAAGQARMDDFIHNYRIIWRNPDPTVGRNTGTAWWLAERPRPGPYDDLEQRPIAERCIVGSRSTGGPPMLPNFYNNFKRIIQTDDHVMILVEMVHDARVVRMNAQHRPSHVRTWMGDSIGRWEGDALVVDTTNFTSTPPLSGADENLHVVERFEMVDADTLLYSFMVDDPTVWTEPWGGEYEWPRSSDKVYEFACHEGNYALGNIMRGARLLEGEAGDVAAGAQ